MHFCAGCNPPFAGGKSPQWEVRWRYQYDRILNDMRTARGRPLA